jgi:hypothetical protein
MIKTLLKFIILIVFVLVVTFFVYKIFANSNHITGEPQQREKIIDEFKENQKHFEVVKDFVISKLNKTSDKKYLKLNLENDNYLETTDDKEVLESFKIISKKLKYVEIFAEKDNSIEINFIRQQGSKSDAEVEIDYTDDKSLKPSEDIEEITIINDNWYFSCWAED